MRIDILTRRAATVLLLCQPTLLLCGATSRLLSLSHRLLEEWHGGHEA
jgi:hypothetical protein